MLTLEKAIEIIELNIQLAGQKMPANTLDALKLVNEASKRLQRLRSDKHCSPMKRLPGEAPQD